MLLVGQHGVTLREGAAAAVLTGEPDRRPLEDQRAEGERLGGRPVYALPCFQHRALRVELTRDLAVEIEVVRHPCDARAGLTQQVQGRRGIAAPVLALRGARSEEHTSELQS